MWDLLQINGLVRWMGHPRRCWILPYFCHLISSAHIKMSVAPPHHVAPGSTGEAAAVATAVGTHSVRVRLRLLCPRQGLDKNQHRAWCKFLRLI